MNTPILRLSAANANQISNDGVKQDWSIRANDSNEILVRLPSHINDVDMFRILDFMKKMELSAFNTGIQFQKTQQNKFFVGQIEELKAVNAFLKDENERMVSILENHLPSEE